MHGACIFRILSAQKVVELEAPGAREVWAHAYPVPGAVAINFGDMLATWSGHKVKSTIHRVVHALPTHRYSTGFQKSTPPEILSFPCSFHWF